MKTKISNLSVELLEEILSRVSVKSIRAVRSTCKTWNVLTKDQRFANKHIEKAAASQRDKEVLVITGDPNYDLINVKFYDFHSKTFDPSTKRNGIVITQQNSDSEVFVSHVFYCNGLLLCLLANVKLRLLVWNPYWGKTRWIKSPRKRSHEMFAFGYDKSSRTHKILRLNKDDDDLYIHMDIYDLSSDSWRILDATFDINIFGYIKPGLSLKGDTYWYVELKDGLLHCFDFTRERFGPHLPLPFKWSYGFNESLSLVKDDKLAVLLEPWDIFEIPVWVTDKIEPVAVSWTMFFKVERLKLNCGFLFGNFLIDKEKKTVVVFDDGRTSYNKTCIIDGETGHLREAEGIKSSHSQLYIIVSNYVPSSVQI